jgi:hypothetical protein
MLQGWQNIKHSTRFVSAKSRKHIIKNIAQYQLNKHLKKEDDKMAKKKID